MLAAMKKQRRTVGAVIEIPLGDGWLAYGQILADADFAFFDTRVRSPMDATEVVETPVLFRVAVMNYAITSGRWRKVGSAPVSGPLTVPPAKFIQDPIDPDRFEIYEGGAIRPAAREECVGLERAAVWDPEHSRIVCEITSPVARTSGSSLCGSRRRRWRLTLHCSGREPLRFCPSSCTILPSRFAPLSAEPLGA